VINRLAAGVVVDDYEIDTLHRAGAVELAATSWPCAALLLRSAVVAATRALGESGTSMGDDALAPLRHVLESPSLRGLAMKASRLRSLALFVVDTAAKMYGGPRVDYISASILQLLQRVGVDTTRAGSLDKGPTPLMAALVCSYRCVAQVVVDSGADVNELCSDGDMWPLSAAVWTRSDDDMAWLLEHGASLTLANLSGHTIAHVLSCSKCAPAAGTHSAAADFCSRWLRRAIAAEPSLLEARDGDGNTPLMSAAVAGSEPCVATLLELGADVGAARADGCTVLSLACAVASLPVVRQLLAAGAASPAVLIPGSVHARLVAGAAMEGAVMSERGCGKCVGRCGGTYAGNCTDGLDILRALLAAGVLEAVYASGKPLASQVTDWMRHRDDARRISPEYGLVILQALYSAGVDVLTPGPADELPIVHAAIAGNAPAVVRWLIAVARAPPEQRNRFNETPLLFACDQGAWDVARALLDCGARVDVQSGDVDGWWPVLLAAQDPDCDPGLLRRILAADRDSLVRCATLGSTALHLAAAENTDALEELLGSGLPHLGDAVNAVWVFPRAVDRPTETRLTPLHCACRSARWDAALALVAAGARVDIAGSIGGTMQTVAAWARSNPACKHRGVKRAIAAQSKQHAAQAAAASRGLPSGGSDAGAGLASAAGATAVAITAVAAAAAAGSGGSACAASGAPADPDKRASAAVSAAGPAARKGKPAKCRKGRRGAARNCAEELPLADAAPELLAACASAAAAADSLPFTIDGSVRAPASAVATEAAAAVAAALSTCEDPAVAAAGATGKACSNAPETPAPAAAATNAPEDPSAQTSHATGASLDAL